MKEKYKDSEDRHPESARDPEEADTWDVTENQRDGDRNCGGVAAETQVERNRDRVRGQNRGRVGAG